MTSFEIEKINELIKALKQSGFLSTKNLADRFYTVRELYDHRLALLKIIYSTYSHLAWKSKKHYDGTMFNDSFLTGIRTPLGNASYHFKMNHFDEFNITEIANAPQYDGYTPDEALNRINSLPLIKNSYIQTLDNTMTDVLSSLVINEENMEKLSKILNELTNLLREMDLIKTVDITDGNHTLKELYKQKRELFKLICHNYYDLSWKSKADINGEFISGDTFFAGLYTPLGPVCYILNNEHFESFNIEMLKKAPLSKDEAHIDVIKKLSSINIRRLKM